MDFRQIEAYIKVVELGSFSKAADALHISQPSVSTYIATLERELDTVLINRSTKVLSTTIAGDRFFEKAKEMMSLRRSSVEALQSLSENASGTISIVASSVPAFYLLPHMLAEFHRHYPNITFTVSQADTAEVVRRVAAHKADIGFAGSIPRDKKCDFIEIVDERLVFVAPPAACGGQYVAEHIYTLDELLYSSAFISRERGSGTRMQYEKYFTENGIVLSRIKTCASMDSTHSIVSAVAHGLGISIVSELAVRDLIAQGKLVELALENPLPERKIYLVLNKHVAHSHVSTLFVDAALDVRGRIGP